MNDTSTNAHPQTRGRGILPRPLVWALWAILILLLCGLVLRLYQHFSPGNRGPEKPQPQAVRVATARTGSMDVFFQALGTVTSPNTVTVKSRVDGQLMALHFTEGQYVKAGDLLAEIDPRPFEVQLQQAQGELARNEALLKDARLDLARYRRLIKEQSVSQQQLQAQESLVGQYEGSVLSGKAAVADAELQLTYSRITAPVSGRVGLRAVDVGNMIRATDSDGLVLITQFQPMDVIFSLVEKQIPDVVAAMQSPERLRVEALGQNNSGLLAVGELLTIDNQIDAGTGTVRARAVFSNEDQALFPNQFVNTRLKVRTLENALIIPSSAVQRSNKGFFVYRVQAGKGGSVTTLVDIVPGYATDTETVVVSGLSENDIVVIDGVDRLRDGQAVTYDDPAPPGRTSDPVAGNGPERSGK